MLRATTTSRPISRGLASALSKRLGYGLANSEANITSHFHTLGAKGPRVLASQFRPVKIPLLRYATKSGTPKYDKIDQAVEKQLADKKLGSDPEAVTTGSSVRKVFEQSQTPIDEGEVMGGLRADLKTIRDTFRLDEVPRDVYYLGAAGTIPYLVTCLSTVYLTHGINKAPEAGSSVYFSHETAYELLAIIEPIQIGFGAVMLSFLGAIHWGLEYAGYGGNQGYRRYAIGCAMPAIAWPTMLMPIEWALITQFVAFTGLYFADARASVKGWAPPWYATYRFVLTLVVGVSIVVSLIGRGEIVFNGKKVPGPSDNLRKLLHSQQEVQRQEQETEKKKFAADAAAGKKGDKANHATKEESNGNKGKKEGKEEKEEKE